MNQVQGEGLIWLASYPKSGNTWARIALYSLLNGGAQVDLKDISHFCATTNRRLLFEQVLEAEAGGLTDEELENLRPILHDALSLTASRQDLWKVHDCWHCTAHGRPIFDPTHTSATIYILRDPRDVAISWAHFNGRSIDWAIASMADPDSGLKVSSDKITPVVSQWLGHWSRHVISWIDESGLSPLVVRYEDMHADLGRVLERIAGQIGWPTTPESIAGAIAASRFERLADQERAVGFGGTPDTAERFFVSGRAGGWRDMLSPLQAGIVERDHQDVMRRFGYL